MLYPISEPIPGSVEDLFGYIDARGKVVIRPSYLACSHFCEGKASVIDKTEKAGFIDARGGLVIPHQFQGLSSFRGGLCATDGGYIDHSGRWIIPPTFLVAGSFSDGRAIASLNGEDRGTSILRASLLFPHALVVVAGSSRAWRQFVSMTVGASSIVSEIWKYTDSF